MYPKISILQIYKTEILASHLDPTNFVPTKEGDTYLSKFNEEFKLNGENKVPKNMILQIKPYNNTDVEFRYDKLSDITANNQTYLDINSKISLRQSEDLKRQTALYAEKQKRLDLATQQNREETEKRKLQSQTLQAR